jgi:PAS domain-containing protein
MNPSVAPVPDTEVLTAQLFRYAQDMEELMRQHNRLQRQHQMILQSLGKEVNGPDLLPRQLMQASPMYWVTDAQGQIRHSSSQLRWQYLQQDSSLIGRNAAQLIRVLHSSSLASLLKRVTEQTYPASALQFRLEMVGSVPSLQGTVWDALLMQKPEDDAADIYWFLSPAVISQGSMLQAQSAYAHEVDSEYGVMAANPFGSICSASPGYCLMTGYAESELMGRNPRLLSSGRH